MVEKIKYTPFMIVLWIYILSIEVFSYRAGFVVITYGVFALLLLFSLRRTNMRITVNPLFIYMFILVIVFGASVAVSVNASQTMRRWITMILMFLTCLFIEWGLSDSTSDATFNFFCKAIIETCVVAFIYDFLSVGPSTYLRYITQGARLTHVASQTNVMGVYGAIALNVMVFKTVFKKRYKLIPLYIAPILMILASQSKKAMLCVLIGVLVMMALKYRKKKFLGIIVLVIMGLLFNYLTSLPIFESVLGRFNAAFSMVTTTTGQVYDWSTYLRMQMIEEGMTLFKQRPLVGYGTDCYQYVASFGTYSHNNYVELLVNNGLVGLVAYYWIYLYVVVELLKRIVKENDDSSILLLTMFLTTLLMDYGEVSYYNKMTYVYIAWALIYLWKKGKEDTRIYPRDDSVVFMRE